VPHGKGGLLVVQGKGLNALRLPARRDERHRAECQRGRDTRRDENL
jgi:hypothetical protein